MTRASLVFDNDNARDTLIFFPFLLQTIWYFQRYHTLHEPRSNSASESGDLVVIAIHLSEEKMLGFRKTTEKNNIFFLKVQCTLCVYDFDW